MCGISPKGRYPYTAPSGRATFAMIREAGIEPDVNQQIRRRHSYLAGRWKSVQLLGYNRCAQSPLTVVSPGFYAGWTTGCESACKQLLEEFDVWCRSLPGLGEFSHGGSAFLIFPDHGEPSYSAANLLMLVELA